MDGLCAATFIRLPQAQIKVIARESVSSMPQASRFVTIVALLVTACLQALAARGKTSVDWFYGFKLHLVVNEHGELLIVTLTPGNTDDRRPVPELLKYLFGKVFASRGYV